MFAGKVTFLAAVILLFGACGADVEPVTPDSGDDTAVVDPLGAQQVPVDPAQNSSDQQGENSSQEGEGDSVLVDEFDPEKNARIWMQVLREEDDSPVVGCPVSLQWTRQGQAMGRIRSETDEKGMARFPVEARVFVQSIRASGTVTSAPKIHVIAKVVQAGDHEPIVLRVKKPAIFRGRVIDEDGNSVPGATIHIWNEKRWEIESSSGKEPSVSGTADQNGYFGVSGVAGGRYVLSAISDGMVAVQRAMGRNGFGETLDGIEIIMATSNMIQGDVLDGANKAVGGAILEVGEGKRRMTHTETSDPRLSYIPPRQWIVKTKSDGGFTIPAVPKGRTWNVRIRHSAFLDTFGKLEADLGVARFYMERGLELHLKVTDTDGKPISNGTAVFMGKSRRNGAVLGGEAILEGLIEDPDAILMVHSLGKAVKTIWPLEFNTAEQPLEVMLEPANPIVGRVVDGEGNPIPKVRLTAKGLDLFEANLMETYPGQQPEQVFDFANRITDEEGKFRIPGLYPGRFELKAVAPDGREWVREVQAGTLDLTILFE